MGKLNAYVFTTLNGYFESPKGDISWHVHAEEENDFAKDSIKPGGMLLFGRVTYEMMAAWWPTPEALKNNPLVAEGMNKADKIVFSRTLQKADWMNTRLIKENIFEEIQKLKDTSGRDMTILGSGSIITQFAEHGMLDSLPDHDRSRCVGEWHADLQWVEGKVEPEADLIQSIQEWSDSAELCAGESYSLIWVYWS